MNHPFHLVYYDCNQDQISIQRDPDYPAFVVDVNCANIKSVCASHVSIPSASGPSSREDLFGALLDVWQKECPDRTPILVEVDFGDHRAEGYAAFKPSTEGWSTMKVLGTHQKDVQITPPASTLANRLDALRTHYWAYDMAMALVYGEAPEKGQPPPRFPELPNGQLRYNLDPPSRTRLVVEVGELLMEAKK